MKKQEKFLCEFCNKQCKNANSQRQHQVRCKNNKNAVSLDYLRARKGKLNPCYGKNWLRNKSPEEIKAIKLGANEKRKKGFLSGRLQKQNRKLSRETKEKLSKIQSDKMNEPGFGSFQHVKYFNVANLNGETFTLRGTWEKSFAEFCNDKLIQWSSGHVLKYENGITRRYHPDIYLNDFEVFIEIKGYFSPAAKKKMKCIKGQLDVKLGIAFKEDLDQLFRMGDLQQFLESSCANFENLD